MGLSHAWPPSDTKMVKVRGKKSDVIIKCIGKVSRNYVVHAQVEVLCEASQATINIDGNIWGFSRMKMCVKPMLE